jgi:S-adenosylmethionine decarboxylase
MLTTLPPAAPAANPAHITFGVHLMLDGYDADPRLLDDEGLLLGLLDRVPASLGMHAIAPATVVRVGPKNRKDPGGLSGVVLIAESHLSFHTFPARGFVTIDLYTCQDDLDAGAVADRLCAAFGIRDRDLWVQRRGLRYPGADRAA